MLRLPRRISCHLILNLCVITNTSLAKIEVSGNFFTPSFNEILTIANTAKDPLQALNQDQGSIVVSPPKGSCFVIRKKLSKKDFMACKEAIMPFSYHDIDESGKLHAVVFQDQSDLGTSVSWQTPYRFGKYIDVFNDKQALPLVIRSCQYEIDPVHGRQVTLTLAGNLTWRILFPAIDKLQPQPSREKPNLYVQYGIHEGGFIKVETEAQRIAREKASTEEQTDIPNESNPDFITSPWQIYPRGAYQMSSSNFKSDDPPPIKARSVCRYNYPQTENQDAEFECHNTHRYKWVYLHLTCLKK